MDIIAHTASVKPYKDALICLINNPFFTKIELDFRFTKDNLLVWSHSDKWEGSIIRDSTYHSLSSILTIYDVLEILNGTKSLLIEIKGCSKKIEQDAYYLREILPILEVYPSLVEVESFNQCLIRLLLRFKEMGFLKKVSLGLIINLFKTFNYRYKLVPELLKIDFVALSNELFEWPIVGNDWQVYRHTLPNVKQYAWSWDALYEETEKRLENYITKGVDGIITSKPELVRKLVK